MILSILYFFFNIVENLKIYLQNIFIDGIDHKIYRINKENDILEKKFRSLDDTVIYNENNSIDNIIKLSVHTSKLAEKATDLYRDKQVEIHKERIAICKEYASLVSILKEQFKK